jgi:hypothetical protein
MRGVQAIFVALSIVMFVPHLHAQDLQSGSYKDGQMDRILWELWFGSLRGKSLAGATYWENHRSIPKTPLCANADIDGSYAWQGGCNEARRRLTASDQRRKLDPEYRQGWDNPERPDAPKEAVEPSSNNAEIVASPAYAAAPAPEATEVAQVHNSFRNVFPIAPTPKPKQTITYNSGVFNKTAYYITTSLSILSLLMYIGRRWYCRVKNYRFIIGEIKNETIKYGEILASKKRDISISDETGTLRSCDWNQEKILFIRTQILPILKIEHRTKFYDKLSLEIDDIIEKAAQQSGSERTTFFQFPARKLFKKYVGRSIGNRRI